MQNITKKDIELLELNLKRDIKALELRLESRIKEVELRLESRIKEVELKIAETKAELIRWVVGVGLLQTTLIAGLLFRLTDKA